MKQQTKCLLIGAHCLFCMSLCAQKGLFISKKGIKKYMEK